MQQLSTRADVDVARSVEDELGPAEGAIGACRLVPDRDVRRDLTVHQPLEQPDRAINRVTCQPPRLKIEAALDTLHHRLGDSNLGYAIGPRALGVNDDPGFVVDPQATWVARPGVDPFFAYDANYLIDNKAGIILDAEGTRANRTVEIAVTQTMMERVRCRFGLLPQRLAGDTVYGAVRLLKWLVDCQIAPHIPVWDKSAGSDGASAVPTSSSIDRATSTSARIGKLLHTTGTAHRLAVRFAIVPQSSIAMSACSTPSARPHTLSNNHAGSAKRSRCGSRI